MTIQHNLPVDFEQRLNDLYGPDQLRELIASFRFQRPVFFRVNTLLANSDQVLIRLQQLGLQVEAVSCFDGVYSVPYEQREILTRCDVFNQGHIYIQSLSSLLPVKILNPVPGEEILDLAAAPGSKTTQMAVVMQNQGRIAAVEKSRARYFKLKDNLKKQGVTCVDTYLKDGGDVWRHCEGRFDRVLIDAPCSSEGRFDLNRPDSMQYWSERKVKEMARKQWRLLYSGLRCVKPGGYVLYSTCTFSPEENEMQVARLLKRFPDEVQVCPINLEGVVYQPGLLSWRQTQFDAQLSHTVRVRPTAHMTGFYLALLKRR